MTPKQRMALRLTFVFITIAGGLLTFTLLHANSAAAFSGTYYGTNESWVGSATVHVFPQVLDNACTVADAAAFVNYIDLMNGLPIKFGSTSTQATIEHNNQTSGASQWGHATPINNVGGITNIAPDFGNDPRSAAYMAKVYNLSSVRVHNYIYRWQFAHTSAPSYATQVLEATTLLARALQVTHAPAIVTINGGLHAVLVTGVFSTSNPSTSLSAGITGLIFRDPEGTATSGRIEVSIGSWTGGHLSTPWGVYSLWSLYYGDRSSVGDKKNTADPEPSVGPYKPTAANPVHWYLGFNWVQVDIPYIVPRIVPGNPYLSQPANPDIAFDAVDNQMMTTP